jgi:CheY-like chemotaxis protein
MKLDGKPPLIVIAEDDEDDRQWVKEALLESQVTHQTLFVTDGEELLDYLRHRGRYAALATTGNLTQPGLVLLDLNMPRKDGREALKEIKADPRLRHIPIVILTTSKAEEDVFRTYSMGANTVIHKPATHDELTAIMQTLTRYWFQMAELPL